MDTIDQISSSINNYLEPIFSNKVASSTISMLLVLYAGLAAPKLPRSISKLFKSNTFKLIVLIFIAYTSSNNVSISIITAVCLVVSLQTLSKHEESEKIEHQVKHSEHHIDEHHIGEHHIEPEHHIESEHHIGEHHIDEHHIEPEHHIGEHIDNQGVLLDHDTHEDENSEEQSNFKPIETGPEDAEEINEESNYDKVNNAIETKEHKVEHEEEDDHVVDNIDPSIYTFEWNVEPNNENNQYYSF